MDVIHRKGAFDEHGSQNKGPHMQDISIYSEFVTRLLNKTSYKEFNKSYQDYRRSQYPKQIASFYKRMENDTMNRREKSLPTK